MDEQNTITMQQYTIKKLSEEIAFLKRQNAELEFGVLALRQEVAKLKEEKEEKEEKASE